MDYLPSIFSEEHSTFVLKEGDVVMALTRPILNRKLKISKLKKSDTPSLLNQRVGKIEVLEGDNLNWIYHLLQSHSSINGFLDSMAGTDPPNLSNKGIYSINIAFPPTLTEQKAIATALSDVDELINSLEKLIAKKKAIKQGAMQELLGFDSAQPTTPRKRLPGFSGDWIERKLEDSVLSISSGTSNTESVQGKYPLYGSTGQIGTKNYCDYNGKKLLVARVGANAGRIYKVNGKYCVSDNTLILTIPVDINIHFIFYSLIVYKLSKLVFGSGQPLITGGQLKQVLLCSPILKEQKAIAKILSDMDLEIESLETKKEKYKSIKNGMMQELLTGKVRLV